MMGGRRPTILIPSWIIILLFWIRLSHATQPRLLVDLVQTDQSCYQSSEQIRVKYTTQMPSLQNLMTLIDSQNQTSRSLWICGSQDEECLDRQDASFGNLNDLVPGNYFVQMKSYGYHGSVQELRSETFQVTHGFCDITDSIHVVTTDGSPLTFTSDSTLQLQFSRTSPRNNDAIGIFPTSVYDISTTPPLVWVAICNGMESASQDCTGTTSVSLDTLPTGEYKAVLGTMVTPSEQRMRSIKTSDPFFVIDKRESAAYRRLEDLPCTDITVKTSQSMYNQGDDIAVSFHRHGCDDGANEIVAIYEAHTDFSFYHASRLPSPKPFLCLGQSVDCPSDHFKGPLPTGSYKAVLVRFWEQKHYYFESEQFQMFIHLDKQDSTRRKVLRSS